MTRNEFDKWLEKKYPILGVMARNIDKTNSEDLLHTTIEYILSHRSYVKVQRGAVYWFSKVMKGQYINQGKHQEVRDKYDALLVPSPLGFNPEKLLEDKIYLKELWPNFRPETRRFLSAIAAGNTAKDFYHTYIWDYGSQDGMAVDYSTFLKAIKADIERGVKNGK